MGVHGARQLMQLQQQFWHGDLAHPHQVASQWEKRGDGHPPVFSNSSPSLFGYDLTSSGKLHTQSDMPSWMILVVCHITYLRLTFSSTFKRHAWYSVECLTDHEFEAASSHLRGKGLPRFIPFLNTTDVKASGIGSALFYLVLYSAPLRRKCTDR
jgi:hypothetical protein